MDTDLRNTRGRLKTLAIAAVIGAVFTFFTLMALLSGRKPNQDPIAGASVVLLAIFDFVLMTTLSAKILAKKR